MLVIIGRVFENPGKAAGRICEKSEVSRDPTRVEARMVTVQKKKRITKSPKRSRFESARMFGSQGE